MTVDARVDKRCVTMRSVRLLQDGNTATEEAVDYVRPDHLDAYVADAQTRWQYVSVSDKPDAGPGGYEGQTAVPMGLSLPDSGVVYPAGKGEGKSPTMFLTDPAPWSAPTSCPAPDVDLDGFLAYHREAFGTATMIATGTGMRTTLSDAYKAAATYADLYQATGATAAGTPISGGAPAYASVLLAWGASANGVVSTGGTIFNIPSGQQVNGFGVKTGAAGAYLDGGLLTLQTFASQGTYTLTLTYTQT